MTNTALSKNPILPVCCNRTNIEHKEKSGEEEEQEEKDLSMVRLLSLLHIDCWCAQALFSTIRYTRLMIALDMNDFQKIYPKTLPLFLSIIIE